MEQPKSNKKERNMNKQFKIQEIPKNIERKDCLLLLTPVFQLPITPSTRYQFSFSTEIVVLHCLLLTFFILNILWNPFFSFSSSSTNILLLPSHLMIALGLIAIWVTSSKQSYKYIILYVCKHMLIYS